MIRLIAAVDEQGGIAKSGEQPWSIPNDEKYFAEITKSYGGVVLMGQKTFEAIGRPLPDRRNIVASHEPRSAEGVEYLQDIAGFLANEPTDAWVIGGAEIYKEAMQFCQEIYLTHIRATFGCDTFFPQLPLEFHPKDEGEIHTQNGFIYSYAVYHKQ